MEDITGKVFGRLTVVGFSHRYKSDYYWNCICECENTKIIKRGSLISGVTKSCGCLSKEKSTKHNLCNTSTYNTWEGMIQRCTNHNATRYISYGEKGITVCDKWLSFEGFYEDMGLRPIGTTLDRVDNNSGYYKENCRWATKQQQDNNRSSNINITYQNKTQTLMQWSRELGINWNTLHSRIVKSKWEITKALSFPVRIKRQQIAEKLDKAVGVDGE